MSNTFTWRRLVVLLMLCVAGLRADDTAARAKAHLAAFAERPLATAMDPKTWVDNERWSVAHACLERGVRLDEANAYFATVQPVSLWHGLVADTDVQVTDLLWTWLRFHDTDRLSDEAKAHLLDFFRNWTVPNPDRNGDADRRYEWPAAYTENHSLNILAAAYFIDVALERDRAAHRDLLLRFLGDRARWGWSEFHSPAYTLVTVKVLSMIAAAAPDEAVATSARLHMDLIAIDFAVVGLGSWRGMPHARGYGSERSNAANSMHEVAAFWWGAGEQRAGGNAFLVHLITSGYRPPAAATRLISDPVARGSFAYRKTVTHGVARQRIPIVAWVSPTVTMASAQGSGAYYDGSYCSISFASSPYATIIARDGKRFCNMQRRNVLLTVGTVTWNGPLKKETTDDTTIGGDDSTWVIQRDLGEARHLIMVAPKTEFADAAALRTAFDAMAAEATATGVTWTMPDGETIAVTLRRDGQSWRYVSATANDVDLRLDTNMLADAPMLRSVRDSGRIEVLDGADLLVYDWTDETQPTLQREPGGSLTSLLPDAVEGPLGMVFLHVPPGPFLMGSPAGEGHERERPQRWERLPSYYLARTEVTVAQYLAFTDATKREPPPDWFFADWGKTPEHPIAWVSWDDAQAFCAWLGTLDPAHTYRLPTEAEWEKAAAGFRHRVYPWGDDYDGSQAGTKNGTYAPVATIAGDVGPFGHRDMAGNIWEWCADWTVLNETRSIRGCGWNFDPDTFRTSYRSSLTPTTRSVHLGLRVLRVPKE